MSLPIRLSERITSTRLHRLYQVGFWLTLVVSFLLGGVSFLASWSIQHRVEELHFPNAKPRSPEFDAYLDELGALIRLRDHHDTIVFICMAALVLLPFVAFAYRLFVYILHGKLAFQDSKSAGPSPNDDSSSQNEQSGRKTDPFTVLGVSTGATFQEIKQAYRSKIREYHPDRVASLGPELRELAERKAKEINEAFEALSRRYGMA